MNDNTDDERSIDSVIDGIVETVWKSIGQALINEIKVPTETIEQMFDRCPRISYFFSPNLSKEQHWILCADKLTEVGKSVFEFAKMTTGFTSLDLNDQLVLLKNGTFELIVIRMSRYIEPSTKCLLLDDAILPERAFYTTDMEEIDLVSSTFNIAKDIVDLKLTVDELAMFSAIVLYNNERPGLIEPNLIEHAKWCIMRCLKKKLDHSNRQPLENGVTVYDALIAKIPELRRIGIMYLQVAKNFELTHPHISLPMFFRELFIWYECRATAA